MSATLARQRAILARLGLDALRGLSGQGAYYPPESLDYNMIMIRAYIVLQVSRGLQRPTAGLHMPRTTVIRHLQRLEHVGVLGREGTGYYPTDPPGTEQGVQFIVSLIIRAAKALSEVGHQNPSSDGQQQTPLVISPPMGALSGEVG
jgi:hypothetical protein